ncbi:aldo/keto reductase [Dacryopinax primogenitus]|uniref:Aldo/keto reductase n=1 Tax=Dacryopinax primogenitus (strain DJM 731) TaxID=1858805 RepID=M5GAN8_DACPD|nr:aldo/keto reductase [Dacryopinax primogenitus]EJU05435.1 aldo/keto reductase [Dacryopinax primogenitus]
MSARIPQTNLGGSASSLRVGKVGHGLMLMTWKPTPAPEDQCFAAIRTSLEHGVGMFNSAEFYGINPREANLNLIRQFLANHPEYTNQMFLSVKSSSRSSEEQVGQSIANISQHLGGKKIDLFQLARVDRAVPVEETMRLLERLREEGLFGHIGLSECAAETLRRACKVAPVAVVEIEVSPFAYEDETKAVIATARELGVTVAAYSPLGQGFLTGSINRSDLERGDLRREGLDKWSEKNFESNMGLAGALKEIAQDKGVTPAQLCIVWVCSLGEHVIPIPGSSHPGRSLENLNAANITLSKEDIEAVERAMEENPVQGVRFQKGYPVWG